MRRLMTYRSRWLLPVLIILAALQLAACGDSEADQRKAFIAFLQSVQSQQDGRLPALTEEQKKSFGNFTNDYAILTTFSQQFNQAVSVSLTPMLGQISRIRVPKDYLTQRDALRQSVGTMSLLAQHVQAAKTQADNAHSTLKQPEEVQIPYERLYARTVIQPTNALLPVIPNATSFAQSLIQVGDFLQAQGDQPIFNGASVQFRTPQQAAQYNNMVAALPVQQRNVMNALRGVNGVNYP
ncbi:DUF3053 domain-containing protein [Pectobacterium parmentieri]|uniref:DUF3053 domain-containing protein n=2 Tax=Pectobacterium parmentieri TaxID=1905730 RepID=A0A0H3I9K0_PECPM|nr:conserved hypothetical protein [Pectobacterium parmentieri WPP163]AFI92672.1 Hypothetical protein W5S_4626 [Pectobacterium parmentieri]AOR61001.1 hypothetical protein A8F97_19215 [Pectobacterium parmentieri]AYH03521.1 DUF3053 domain-containing protein [Pectobacterium parmentieri]AYH07857.1 DUF3053 domain-containing protein [Pectobacterium parmentieri]